ncbi:hypothetical protein RhiirA4_481426 [Rhizophagus irregularis]|uniref:Uncharacterized protein n=1 Tax=Rhizophagus irregularis TaxID=588596 RepID=A0A2I1HJI8_9GLOM|nr:hypothetical protein RhiirA4_481426 [Rhizophagus irregularis]
MERLPQNTTIVHAIDNKDDIEVDRELSFDEFLQIIESTSSERMQEILNEMKEAIKKMFVNNINIKLTYETTKYVKFC